MIKLRQHQETSKLQTYGPSTNRGSMKPCSSLISNNLEYLESDTRDCLLEGLFAANTLCKLHLLQGVGINSRPKITENLQVVSQARTISGWRCQKPPGVLQQAGPMEIARYRSSIPQPNHPSSRQLRALLWEAPGSRPSLLSRLSSWQFSLPADLGHFWPSSDGPKGLPNKTALMRNKTLTTSRPACWRGTSFLQNPLRGCFHHLVSLVPQGQMFERKHIAPQPQKLCTKDHESKTQIQHWHCT